MSVQVSSDSQLSTVAQQRSAFLAKLLDLASFSFGNAGRLQKLRIPAIARVQEQPLPSTRDEAWRFTDLSGLLDLSLVAPKQVNVTPEALAPVLLPEAPHRLVFVNGFYSPSLSSTANLPAGLTIGNLSSLSEAQQQYLGQQPGAEELFTALNTAGLTDTAVVLADRNLAIEKPIQLLFIATGPQSMLIQPRCLVVAEPNSALTLVEEYLSLNAAAYFTNAVTEIWLQENAQVNHLRVQRESSTAFHVGKTAVSQARSSRYSSTAVSLGAQVSRHNLEIYQTGEQTETHLNGLTVLRGQQVGDTHSTIALSKPHGMTRQLHKCIVDDRAHAVFNGRVLVPQAAQLTDAGQLNRNLLLSPKARVDTKPQLEIVADNVKCTHGATVGQLETDEIFYLQSRGIDAASARKLLVYAFAFEVLEQIPLPTLRQALTDLVTPS